MRNSVRAYCQFQPLQQNGAGSCVPATYTKKLKMPNKERESNSITGGDL